MAVWSPELATEKATSVGLDVVFAERRPDLGFVQMADGTQMESDDFFGLQMRLASNVVIAATTEIVPPPSFTTNALALGHINTDRNNTDKDADGILRRAKAFDIHQKWHFAFQKVEDDAEYGVDLSQGRIESNHVILPRSNGENIVVPLDSDGNFDPTTLWANLPPSLAAKAKPFSTERIWHMGIVLAAHQMNLDLDHADVDLSAGRIILRGATGLAPTIPDTPNG